MSQAESDALKNGPADRSVLFVCGIATFVTAVLQFQMAGILAAPLEASVLLYPGAFSIPNQVVIGFAGFYISFTLCHGEAASVTPEPDRLRKLEEYPSFSHARQL